MWLTEKSARFTSQLDENSLPGFARMLPVPTYPLLRLVIERALILKRQFLSLACLSSGASQCLSIRCLVSLSCRSGEVVVR